MRYVEDKQEPFKGFEPFYVRSEWNGKREHFFGLCSYKESLLLYERFKNQAKKETVDLPYGFAIQEMEPTDPIGNQEWDLIQESGWES